MKLLVVNPNTSASMTARIGAAARAAAAAGTEIVAVNPESGPASGRSRGLGAGEGRSNRIRSESRKTTSPP
jgi:Asp/Glu/hydantoin racemase